MVANDDKQQQDDGPRKRPVATPKKKPAEPPVRAINEDDDGYDPYSDLHDRAIPEPLFEEDPWS